MILACLQHEDVFGPLAILAAVAVACIAERRLRRYEHTQRVRPFDQDVD